MITIITDLNVGRIKVILAKQDRHHSPQIIEVRVGWGYFKTEKSSPTGKLDMEVSFSIFPEPTCHPHSAPLVGFVSSFS